jgi:hypothetical protein
LLGLGRFLSYLNFYTVGRTPWMVDQPVAKRLTVHIKQHKHTINADIHPYLKWDSNPRSQCLSGRRHFMPKTARPLRSSKLYIAQYKSDSNKYVRLNCHSIPEASFRRSASQLSVAFDAILILSPLFPSLEIVISSQKISYFPLFRKEHEITRR